VGTAAWNSAFGAPAEAVLSTNIRRRTSGCALFTPMLLSDASEVI